MMRSIMWQIVIVFNLFFNKILTTADLVKTSDNGYFITGRGCGVTNKLKYLKYVPDPKDWENHGCTFIELTDQKAPLKGNGKDLCDKLEENVNKLAGAKTSTVTGWNVGVENGQWKYSSGDGIYTKCGNGQAWFGWKSGNGVGSISTTLTAASGRGQLSFGNCWDNGNVKVYLDGNEISAADPNTQKIVEFDFKAGAILMLRDEGGNSVIQFTKFTILNCGTFHNTNL